MSIKLTDTQLLTLSAAAQREDRCIAAPPNLKGAAALKFATRLVAAGLVKEVKAKPGSHVWRRDDAIGQAYALELTVAGLKAIAVDETEAVEAASEISPPAPGEAPTDIVDLHSAVESVASPTAIAVPRKGSKLATVVGLLRSEGGATIDQLAAEMGWLPHTTRAVLTGLRKRGFNIGRRQANEERASAYVIVDSPNSGGTVKQHAQGIALECDGDSAASSSGGGRGVRPRRGFSDRHRSRSGTSRTGTPFSRRPPPSLEKPLGPACAGPPLSRSSLSRHGLSPSG